jgi:hypothetical protein
MNSCGGELKNTQELASNLTRNTTTELTRRKTEKRTQRTQQRASQEREGKIVDRGNSMPVPAHAKQITKTVQAHEAKQYATTYRK